LICLLGAIIHTTAGQPVAAPQAAQIYARATNQFQAAILFKPAQTTNNDPGVQLAPLILQQDPYSQTTNIPVQGLPAKAARPQDIPASSFVICHSSSSNSPALPTIFWHVDTVQLNGKLHARVAYRWFYVSSELSKSRTALPSQGFRITLDSRGQPAVWEVLADTSGLRLIFVSQSLEAAAASEFGKPPASRRYSIERSLDQAPDVIVPRVIEDGSLAMGPIVYLCQGTRDVSTLICRCMPAQAKQLRATRAYDLDPLDGLPLASAVAVVGIASNSMYATWPGDDKVENRLDHCLRFPGGF
jgi:hypothetical protein